MLMKFLYPPNIEHSNVNSRLDVFSLYGPVLNYHSVDNCFCIPCARIGKEYLQEYRARLVNIEKERMGLSTNKEDRKMTFTTSSTGNKFISNPTNRPYKEIRPIQNFPNPIIKWRWCNRHLGCTLRQVQKSLGKFCPFGVWQGTAAYRYWYWDIWNGIWNEQERLAWGTLEWEGKWR